MVHLTPMIKSYLSHIGHLLIPEFLASSTSTPPKRRHASDTAWLDGVRGVAALMVVLQHEQSMAYMGHAYCYRYPEQTSPASWPILRLAFSGGSFAVVVFFYISGYVVPRRLLKLLQEGRQPDFIEALNSAFIRRHGRLLLPAMFSSLLTILFFWATGLEPSWQGGFAPSFWKEIGSWLLDSLALLNYFTAFASYYNGITWTIVIELKGSMMVFAWLFAIHSLKPQWRICLSLGFSIGLAMFTPYSSYAAFLIGMASSELDLLHDSGELKNIWLPWKGLVDRLQQRRLARMIFLHCTLLLGLLLASFPMLRLDLSKEAALARCSSWPSFLFSLTPSQYAAPRDYWYFWASWLTMVSTSQLRWAKSMFESSFPQYLGRHSFSLYLTHLAVGSTFSRVILILVGFGHQGGTKASWPYNKIPIGAWSGVFPAAWGPFGFQPGMLLDLALSLPLMFWIAEIGTKILDLPSVRISAWMWKKWKSMR